MMDFVEVLQNLIHMTLKKLNAGGPDLNQNAPWF